MRFLIFCCLLITTHQILAQNYQVSGYVKDATTSETLIGATVYNKTTGAGTTTNEYGFYSVQAAKGINEIVFSYIGYQTQMKKLPIQQDTTVQMLLTDESVAIEDIVVTYDEVDEKLETATMSVNTLDAETIQNIPVVLGEVDLVKSIQLLPGVTNNGEASNGFNVRGGSEDQNLVLLDEAIIYNAAHVLGFISVFNNDAVKDVKLYKGGMPARFGGRISSVLDVRQKDGNKREFGGTGGIGLLSSRLLLEGPIQKENASFLVAGRSSYIDLFLKAADNPNRLNFYDLNTKLNWEIDSKNQLFLSGYFGNDLFALSDFFENAYGNETANLRWNHVYSNKLFSNLSMIYSRYRYRLDFNTFDFKWDSGIKNLNLKYDLTWFVNNNMDIQFGAGAIGYDFNPGEIQPSDESSSIQYRQLEQKRAIEGGVYVEAKHDLSDRIAANYGVRYSNFFRMGGQAVNRYTSNQPVVYNDERAIYQSANPIGTTEYSKTDVIDDYHFLEPRLSIAYELSDKQSIKASYNRTAQYIHLISNTTSPTPFDVWAPSGEFIEPQIGNQFAVGYIQSFLDKEYVLELEAYHKTVNNRLDYIDGAELIANDAIEQVLLPGEMEAMGIELLLQKQKGVFNGWLSYTLSEAKQRTTGGAIGGNGINEGNWYPTNYDRTHDVSFTGNYDFNERWDFSANFILQTGRPVTYPEANFTYQNLQVASYSNRNSSRLPIYHRLDLSASLYPKKENKLESYWTFGVYNAYNRMNANSISFTQNAETLQNEATKLSVFGIVPAISWNIKF